jgi:hypothetical protein
MNASEKALLARAENAARADRNAYSKGYNAGVREHGNRFRELDEALLAMQARAERAERGIGLGRCDQCLRWRRQPGAKWGYCTLTENSVGTDWPWRGDPDQRIATKENFGCIRFADPSSLGVLNGRVGKCA